MKQFLVGALLILCLLSPLAAQGSKEDGQAATELVVYASVDEEIGRASCRERV